jgi:hypothetical protein
MQQTQWTAVLEFDTNGEWISTRDLPVSFAEALASESAAQTAGWPAQRLAEARLAFGEYPREQPITREQLKLNAIANGRECPECGEREGLEWNGGKGVDCSYGCHGGNGCGHQWDASEYREPPADPVCRYCRRGNEVCSCD